VGGAGLVESMYELIGAATTGWEIGVAKPVRDGTSALAWDIAQGKVRAHWSGGQCEQSEWVGRSQLADTGECW
jgi:hypothetical protein